MLQSRSKFHFLTLSTFFLNPIYSIYSFKASHNHWYVFLCLNGCTTVYSCLTVCSDALKLDGCESSEMHPCQYCQVRVNPFSQATCERTRQNDLKWPQERLRLTVRRKLSLKTLPVIGTDCPGKCWYHHTRRYLKDVWIWHLKTWFTGGLGSIG